LGPFPLGRTLDRAGRGGVTGLSELYASLLQPAELESATARIFSVLPIGGRPGYFVGRGVNDEPALLIEIRGRARAPIALKNLLVTFNTPCALKVDREQRDTCAVVIECRATDSELQNYFLIITDHLLDRLGPAPNTDQVAAAIDALVSLFQKLSRSPRREAQGLFGELLVIATASDPAALLNAWHTDPLDRFDFIFPNSRLEVKTNANRQRRHEFSFEQCNPPVDASATVVSLFVETAGGGLSLNVLVERIEARLGSRPELILKLHSVLADTLGTGLLEGLSQRFDEQLALSSLAFYDLSTIPAVRDPLPPGVTAVRFRSEFGALVPLDSQELERTIPGLIVPRGSRRG
jgi:hypothetical protein